MKNLKQKTKRLLSFALALLMVVSTMFVGGIQAKADTGVTYEPYYDAETEGVVGAPEIGTMLTTDDIIKAGDKLGDMDSITLFVFPSKESMEEEDLSLCIQAEVVKGEEIRVASLDEAEKGFVVGNIKKIRKQYTSTNEYGTDIFIYTYVEQDDTTNTDNATTVNYYITYLANAEDSTEYGVKTVERNAVNVEKEIASNEDTVKELVKEIALEVDMWDAIEAPVFNAYVTDSDDDGYFDIVELYLDTSNYSMVHLGDSSGDWSHEYIVTPGETFYFPTEMDGQKAYWVSEASFTVYYGSYTVPSEEELEGEIVDLNFSLIYEDKLWEDAEIVVNPTKPVDPVVPPVEDEDDKDPVVPPVEDEDDKDPVVPPVEDEDDKDPVVPPTEDKDDVVVENDYSAKIENEDAVAEKIELTDAEKEAIASGEELEVILVFNEVGKTATTEEQKAIEKELGNKKVGTFLEIDLTKKIGDYEAKVSETTGAVAITFELPAELKADKNTNRTYSIVRYHDGNVDILDAKYDAEKGTITFETDKFSTYAVVYEDVAIKAPVTGDTTNVAMYVMLLVCGAGIIVASRKMNRI